MTDLPACTTPDEIEFAKLWLDCERNRRMAGDRMWPKLTSDSAYKKAGKWLEKPGVQFALQAFGESTKHDVRLWLERVGFGEKDRVERAAIIGKHSQDPLKYIEYCDKRSGVAIEQPAGTTINVFTAVATGDGVPSPCDADAELRGVRFSVSSGPDQDGWAAPVPVVAHAVAPGAGADTS